MSQSKFFHRAWEAILPYVSGSSVRPAPSPPQIIVVQNWDQELKRLVPPK